MALTEEEYGSIPALRAEVERLTAENNELKAEKASAPVEPKPYVYEEKSNGA